MSPQGNNTFDPYGQTITVLDGNMVPYPVALATINSNEYYTVSVTINLSTQLGACIAMLLAVCVVGGGMKKKHLIFWLNISSLFLCALARLLEALFFVGPYNSFYALTTYDYTHVTREARALSIFSSIIPLFLQITINVSLILQVRAVLTQTSWAKWLSNVILGVSGFVFLLALSFRSVLAAENIITILQDENFLSRQWLLTSSMSVEVILLIWFCGIFNTKLIATCIMRRRMKTVTRSFGMEVLIIGTFYTMLVPMVFAIVQICRPEHFQEAGSLSITSTALLLPLTALWAQNVEIKDLMSKKSSIRQNLWHGSNTSGGCLHCKSGAGSGSTTVAINSSGGPTYHDSRNQSSRRPSGKPVSDIDLELGEKQHLDPRSIHTTNTVVIHSEEKL